MTTPPLRESIARHLPELVRLRRDLHRHPELSDQERRTSALVLDELRRLGIAAKGGFGRAGTGVVGYLPATGPANGGGATALRADMDALPIDERTGRDYVSGTPGVMHACGHDGHTTILLGAARILASLPPPLRRSRPVTFLFQPAEEHLGGAGVMCEQGALGGEKAGGLGEPVARVYGLHGWPQVELGHIATRAGPLLAATDDFEVRVVGSGGHAAYPHLCRDPIVALAAVIQSLQALASRATAPHDSLVCTVGKIEGGSASNIIPVVARFWGTIRTLRAETRAMAKRRFYELVEQAAASHGCRAEIDWREGYPMTENDPAEARRVLTIAAEALGPERSHEVEHATMGGEDFAYYGKHAPSCFFFLGLRPPGAASYPALHQPDFDFNDEALPAGIEMMCRLALDD
ncbi:MAG: M20 family metallopeptidase [Phycisphaerales bacterium]